MSERIRYHTSFMQARCPHDDPDGSCYNERIEDPTDFEQKAVVRRARAHARKTGHRVRVIRCQNAVVEA